MVVLPHLIFFQLMTLFSLAELLVERVAGQTHLLELVLVALVLDLQLVVVLSELFDLYFVALVVEQLAIGIL